MNEIEMADWLAGAIEDEKNEMPTLWSVSSDVMSNHEAALLNAEMERRGLGSRFNLSEEEREQWEKDRGIVSDAELERMGLLDRFGLPAGFGETPGEDA